MKKEICFSSFDELDRDELRHFEEGNDIGLWAEKMRESDPSGEKADALAERYQK